jgi:hypothetical protein
LSKDLFTRSRRAAEEENADASFAGHRGRVNALAAYAAEADEITRERMSVQDYTSTFVRV